MAGIFPALAGYAGMTWLVVHETVHTARHAVRCHTNRIGDRCTCPLSHRFLAGRTFHGRVVTDATYWTRAADVAGHVSPFQKLPGWKRRALRTGPVLAFFGALISWALTATVVGVLTGCVVTWWVTRRTAWGRRMIASLAGAAKRRTGRLLARLVPGWVRDRQGRHHGSRMQDMAQALATITGSAAVAVKPQIDWNPAYASAEPGEHVGTWYLPRGFKASPGERRQVEDLWRNRVGFDLVFEWRMHDARPHVVLTRARELPKLVYLHEVLEKVEALPDHKTAIGVDDQGSLVCWNWSSENPHGVINAGSRHGKSELNKFLIGQILHKGGGVTYIDPKEISIQGMEGVPGLILLNDPGDIPAMWEGVAAFRKMMDGRRRERADDPTAVSRWNRQLLVLEEVNQFSEMSDEAWEDLEEENPLYEGTMLWKPKRAKKVPPVWRHVKAIAWQGAAFKMHLIVDGQDVQATVLKGVRNSLGMRLLGGYLPQQWKFLVGTTPVPPAPRQRGRWCLVNGVDQTWVQSVVGDLDPDESSKIWRDYARDGRRLDGTVPVSEGATEGAPVETPGVVTHGGTAGQRVFAAAHAKAVPVSLAEAVKRGFAPGATLKALRQDRYRSDKGELPDGLVFPKPIEEVAHGQTEKFWSNEIAEFNARRRGARVA